MNKTRSKLLETQNFLTSPRMYALNATRQIQLNHGDDSKRRDSE